MKTALFDFDLPPERIATEPVFPRDASRLLVVSTDQLDDRLTRELPDLLQPGDVMVFNDTKVIPARLMGKRGEVAVEVTLHKQLNDACWRAFARPGKRIRVGNKILFSKDFSCTVKEKNENGEITLDWGNQDWRAGLAAYGKMPLPPYLKRDAHPDENERYQTIYAQREGAVAAPSAGLHFTNELTEKLDDRGIKTRLCHVACGRRHLSAGKGRGYRRSCYAQRIF